jgi:formylglycine-generating enzyme required for sulfatase activity
VHETTLVIGPSDWEADGRVVARTIHVDAFRIDAFETTEGRWRNAEGRDASRAASGMTRDEASAFCASRHGRLPSEDEWIAAAASGTSPARRYPWGDTGAVCRRAAWGLLGGPCGVGARGPDTVGAHVDGDSPLGVHDLAGNVAEWVGADDGRGRIGIAKGGSWQSPLATELRIWSRLEIEPGARDVRVGVRCAYPA